MKFYVRVDMDRGKPKLPVGVRRGLTAVARMEDQAVMAFPQPDMGPVRDVYVRDLSVDPADLIAPSSCLESFLPLQEWAGAAKSLLLSATEPPHFHKLPVYLVKDPYGERTRTGPLACGPCAGVPLGEPCASACPAPRLCGSATMIEKKRAEVNRLWSLVRDFVAVERRADLKDELRERDAETRELVRKALAKFSEWVPKQHLEGRSLDSVAHDFAREFAHRYTGQPPDAASLERETLAARDMIEALAAAAFGGKFLALEYGLTDPDFSSGLPLADPDVVRVAHEIVRNDRVRGWLRNVLEGGLAGARERREESHRRRS